MLKFCLHFSVWWCWNNSNQECQISNSRVTRIANFVHPLLTTVGVRLRSFPQENFLVFHKKQCHLWEYPMNIQCLWRLRSWSCDFHTIHYNVVICNIAIYADATTLYPKSDLWQQLEWASQLNLTNVTLWTGTWSDLWILILKKLKLFHFASQRVVVLFMWKLMDPYLMKNYLLRCWDFLSLLNWIGGLTLCLC